MSLTPICDFVNEYVNKKTVRAHMPGHKGNGETAIEALDITEVDGADKLFTPEGIIAESEKNASGIFGCPTFYSAEGSSLCVRAMLYMAVVRRGNESRTVIAARNVHSSFVSAAALLDLDVEWLYPESGSSYLTSDIDPYAVEKALSKKKERPAAVYVTSPDYLGNVYDIKGVAAVCKKYSVPLIVDNAHGAYLKFLDPSAHPIDLGADMCCDSAHKTLPVLTGGAYLHINGGDTYGFCGYAKQAMSLFASTSPSYLILQSLDKANAYLKDHKERLNGFIPYVIGLKTALIGHGFTLIGDEALKVTVTPKPFGYTGDELALMLEEKNVVCEFHDKDNIVLMLSPENPPDDIERIKNALLSVKRLPALTEKPPVLPVPERAMSIRQAVMSKSEKLPVEKCAGRALSSLSTGCPPAVPVLISGEIINKYAAECMAYYGIYDCFVIAR